MTGRNRRNFSPEFRLEAAQLVLDQHDTIISCQRPDHRYKKASKEHIEIPNYLDRQFTVTEPNQAWCGDVTYIWAGKRWAYLAVVLDLFSCKPVQETQYDAVRKVIYRGQ